MHFEFIDSLHATCMQSWETTIFSNWHSNIHLLDLMTYLGSFLSCKSKEASFSNMRYFVKLLFLAVGATSLAWQTKQLILVPWRHMSWTSLFSSSCMVVLFLEVSMFRHTIYSQCCYGYYFGILMFLFFRRLGFAFWGSYF